MNVGTKELKNRLSHYLRRVRAGEVVRVMDRNVVVAEIRRAAPEQTDERVVLRDLESEGLVMTGHGRFDDVEPIRVGGGSLSREILDQRR